MAVIGQTNRNLCSVGAFCALFIGLSPPAMGAEVDPAARRAFFGELHLHTTMSFDAWTFGTKITPDQAYKFARETSQLKASYGERIQRPNDIQLDPFRTERNPLLFSAGNPDLRPMITQSYELGYEYRHKTTDLQATLFYKDRSNLLTQVTQDIGGGALLSIWSNLGRSRDLGLELVANRDLTKTLSINASADLMHSQVDTANLGLTDDHFAFVVSARMTLNWQVSPNDFVQLGIQQSGRQLTA